MLAAVSGKVDSIISYIWKYVIVHICFKVYMFQNLLSIFTSLLGNMFYIRECILKHLRGSQYNQCSPHLRMTLFFLFN